MTRESGCHIPQKTLLCHIIARLKREAAASGAQRIRAHLQAAGSQSDAAEALGPRRAAVTRASASRATLRREQGTLQPKAGSHGDTVVSMGREAKAEQQTMTILAKTVRDGQSGAGRSNGRSKRGRAANCMALEQGTVEAAGGGVKELAVKGEPTQAIALQGLTGRRKARPAVEAELEEGTKPMSASREKRHSRTS